MPNGLFLNPDASEGTSTPPATRGLSACGRVPPSSNNRCLFEAIRYGGSHSMRMPTSELGRRNAETEVCGLAFDRWALWRNLD